MFRLRSRACVICGKRATTHRRLEIYSTETKSWRKRARPVCSKCASRVDFAAGSGSLNSGSQVPLVDVIASAEASASPRGGEGGSARRNLVVSVISLVSVLVILAFGALATFGSPLYFFGAIMPFVPLGFVAWRSGDNRRAEQDPHGER
jgi:hypothetical protein